MNQRLFCLLLASALAVAGAYPAAAQNPPPRPPRPAPPTPPAAMTQGWLGISYDAFREDADRRTREYAVVRDVHPGSPAQRAGLQRGDTIVRLNGGTDVERRIRALRLEPGDTVRVRVRRTRERDRDLTIVAGRRPAPVAIARTRPGAPLREGQAFELRRVPGARGGVMIINGDTIRIPLDSLLVHADSVHQRIRVLLADSLGPRLRELETRALPELRGRVIVADSLMRHAFPESFVFEVGRRAVAGAEFSELNPDLAEYFQGVREGLLVLRVAPDSPAARAGLQAGDVVVRANGETVRTTADLRRHVADARRDDMRLGIIRKGRQVELRLR